MNLDEIGTAFMVARKSHGWNQWELGERAGCSRAEISLIELAKGNPTIVTLTNIARVLGFSIRVELTRDEQ